MNKLNCRSQVCGVCGKREHPHFPYHKNEKAVSTVPGPLREAPAVTIRVYTDKLTIYQISYVKMHVFIPIYTSVGRQFHLETSSCRRKHWIFMVLYDVAS